MKFRFTYLDKRCMKNTLPFLFDILHSNMNIIAPTGNTYEEDFLIWYDNVLSVIHKPARQIVLMYNNDKIVGYFQFYAQDKIFMMEEIQIIPDFQGTGLFRVFFMWIFDQLHKDIQFVEAYSHKNNVRSQGILEHFGLKKVGMNKSCNSYFYKGSYKDLLNAFVGK